MNKKFVCLECGCHKVEGEIPAMVELKVNEVGEIVVGYIDYDFNNGLDGLVCSECGGNEIAEIGKRMVY